MTWSAERYSAFEDERTRPVRDLLSALPIRDARTAVDLGCGPGNSPEALAARLPGATVTGLDASPDMLAAARRRLPHLRFELGTIEAWAAAGAATAPETASETARADAPGPFDAILANAALHWLPDHATLLPRLLGKLAPGGVLAVQMPDNLDEPAHRLMREVAQNGPWADKLAAAAAARTPLGDPAWYYGLLRPLCAAVDVWRTVYHHPLAGGADAVVAWFESSGLRPFLDPLDAAGRAGFLARYREAVARAHPALPDGTVLLPFPRLFFVATR